jgi:uncharacterized protein (DUF1697 family)
MRDLADLFSAAGGENVETYIQSGNVLFDAPAKVAEEIPDRIVRAINERFGYKIALVMRSAQRLARVVARNPFHHDPAVEATLHVLFLAGVPDVKLVERLDPDRSPGDEFIIQGSEVYLKLPHGVARSKLTNDYFGQTLGTYGTQRNWRTVNKLLALTDE